MNYTPTSRLSADKPLEDPDDDRLDFRDQAELIADGLHRMSPVDGFVVAIYGAWGAGKSTFVKFMLHFLANLPKDKQPLVVHFNPWWFSGQEELTLRFFNSLITAINDDPNRERKEKLSKIVERITGFASQITLPVFGGAFIKGTSSAMYHALKDRPDVHTLKKQVDDALAKIDDRILVVIDDIDRSTPEEILQVFKLVKAVGDFPRVTYLLAFDRPVVVRALEASPIVSGQDYLEKIVQASFELPSPTEEDLKTYLAAELQELFEQTPAELRNDAYWDSIWNSGLNRFLSTPRNIVRLANALRVTYPPVQSEVIRADFVAIEALRLFCPDAYGFLRHHKGDFAGVQPPESGFQHITEHLKTVYEQIAMLVADKDRQAFDGLLRQVFPKYDGVLGTSVFDDYGDPLETLCVAWPEAFDVYFRLRLPLDKLSNKRMKEMMNLFETEDRVAEMLDGMADPTAEGTGAYEVQQFVFQLHNYFRDGLLLHHAPPLIRTIVLLGDRLIQATQGLNTILISRCVVMLLHCCNEANRTEILCDAVAASAAVGTLAMLVVSLEYEHGLSGPGLPYFEEPLVELESVRDLRTGVLEKLHTAARDGSILQAADLYRTLHQWKLWAGIDEVRRSLVSVTGTDTGLIQLLRSCLTLKLIHLPDDLGTYEIGSDVARLGEFVDVQALAARANSLLDSAQLDQGDRLVMQGFVQAVQGTGTAENAHGNAIQAPEPDADTGS